MSSTAGAKKPSTATTKLVTEMEQKAAAQGMTAESMTALTARHVCKSKKCINFDRYCWVNKDDQVHYKLNSGHFIGWNEAITANRGDTSVDRPPAYIVESLYRQKKAERKEKKASVITANPFGGVTDSSKPPAQSMYPGYPPPPFPPYPYYPPAPPQSQPTDSLIAILALKEKKKMDREEKEKQERQPGRSMSTHHHGFTSLRPELELRSSPVQEDLEEYIQWHI